MQETVEGTQKNSEEGVLTSGESGMPGEQSVYVRKKRARVLGGWFLDKEAIDKVPSELEK